MSESNNKNMVIAQKIMRRLNKDQLDAIMLSLKEGYIPRELKPILQDIDGIFQLLSFLSSCSEDMLTNLIDSCGCEGDATYEPARKKVETSSSSTRTPSSEANSNTVPSVHEATDQGRCPVFATVASASSASSTSSFAPKADQGSSPNNNTNAASSAVIEAEIDTQYVETQINVYLDGDKLVKALENIKVDENGEGPVLPLKIKLLRGQSSSSAKKKEKKTAGTKKKKKKTAGTKKKTIAKQTETSSASPSASATSSP